MSKFSDMMNSPLRSKTVPVSSDLRPMMESVDKEIDELTATLFNEGELFGVGTMDKPSDEHYEPEAPETMGVKTTFKDQEHVDMSDVMGDTTPEEDDDLDDDFDLSDISDAELAELDKALGGDVIDSIANDGEDDDDDDEVKLSPSEEVDADDMMSVAATSEIIRDELNHDEKEKFLSNESEVKIAISEGFLTESDVNELAMEEGLVEEKGYSNKMIIRLNKQAKMKQLYALALNVCAAAHHDPDYVKYKKAMRLKKLYRAKFERKYRAEATKRMKIYFRRLSSSGSSILSKIGNRLSGGK